MSDKRNSGEIIRDAQIDRANNTRDHEPSRGTVLNSIPERQVKNERNDTYRSVRDHEKK